MTTLPDLSFRNPPDPLPSGMGVPLSLPMPMVKIRMPSFFASCAASSGSLS